MTKFNGACFERRTGRVTSSIWSPFLTAIENARQKRGTGPATMRAVRYASGGMGDTTKRLGAERTATVALEAITGNSRRRRSLRGSRSADWMPASNAMRVRTAVKIRALTNLARQP